ncbi:MAG TPA: trypsin-like peptidase domain-containing protein [Bacillota bacterium]|jgi:serine protease Do|nr:trypsin-like peptidase domain-containing protein [Bacillota bacterium]HPZ14534.1 trypsin-like peptidase domain-containing protein [Bacillota bacterium]HQD80880.1 trypsin-like peptidase domain-containing protein [Bacillota bacterium]
MGYYDRWGRPRGFGFPLFVAALVGAVIGGLVVGMLLIGRIPQQQAAPAPQLSTPSDDEILPPSERLSAEAYSIASAAKKVSPAVVKIATRQEELVFSFFFRPIIQEREGLGSGVIIDASGHILTNYHVIKNVTEIVVVLADGRQFPGSVVGVDPYTDLAVVKIEGEGLPVAELGNSDQIVIGEPVVAIGNPYGFDHTVTAGVVSALNRSISTDERDGVVLENLIQTDAPINPGNSGGALVTTDGKVVGINTAIIQGAQGIGFAIPINVARNVANEIIQYGKVKRPYLGVSEVVVVSRDIALRYGLAVDSGIYVSSVVRGSPADRAGLGRGDIIIAINGAQVATADDVRRCVLKSSIGDKMTFTVVGTNRRQRDVVVTLGEMP